MSVTLPSSVLFRCDAWPAMGYGHVVRCLALADELREAHECEVAFAMIRGTPGASMAVAKGYRVVALDREALARNYAGWLEAAVDEVGADALVLDVRNDLPVAALRSLKEKGILIATIDDPSDRRLMADLAFYPPVPQVGRMDWRGFSGELSVGWEWVVLRREFSRRAVREKHDVPVVLVTMGGSDPCGMTLKAVEALDLLGPDLDLRSLVLLGPGFLHHEALEELVAGAHRKFELLSGVDDIAGLMARSDLALGSFGVTSYELAAMGVPGIYLCLTEDHAESASTFVEAGMGECLGVHDRVTSRQLCRAIRGLLLDRPGLQRMAKSCTRNMDGKGARRVADKIAGRIVHGD